MKKLSRMLLPMLCLVMLLGAFPITASAATTEALKASDWTTTDVNVKAGDGDYITMQAKHEDMWEAVTTYDKPIDTAKTPYLIIHMKDFPQFENWAYMRMIANDRLFTECSQIDKWIVVDLRKFANKDGKVTQLKFILMDYHYKDNIIATGEHSVFTLGCWVTDDSTLGGKVDNKKLYGVADLNRLIDKETVAHNSEFISESSAVMTLVGDTGYDVMVNPDQELERYAHNPTVQWWVYIDLDKVPYFYLNLAEHDAAFVLVFHLVDPMTGSILNHISHNYITATDAAGWLAWDMGGEWKVKGKTGKAYLRISMYVDDGMTAGGMVNYIKKVMVSDKKMKDPDRESNAQVVIPSTGITTPSTGAGDTTPSTNSGVDTTPSTNSGVDTTPSTTAPAGDSVGTDEGGSSLIIIIIVAAVVLAAGASIVVFVLRKKKA